MDYDVYRFTPIDWLKVFLLSVGSALLVSELFYDTWLGLPGSVGCILLFGRILKKRRLEERKRQLTKEFLDAMQVVSNSLLAGSSIENAWGEAEKEMTLIHGEQGLMCRELKQMNTSLGVNLTLEELLEDFANRSGIDEIRNFSEVFSFAKRSGGNLVSIIENTIRHMRARIEVEQEIEVLVSSKRLEQKILNVIPLLILAYLKFTSYDYLGVLYNNLFGILFMTGALGAYLGAMVLSERILRIRM